MEQRNENPIDKTKNDIKSAMATKLSERLERLKKIGEDVHDADIDELVLTSAGSVWRDWPSFAKAMEDNTPLTQASEDNDLKTHLR